MMKVIMRKWLERGLYLIKMATIVNTVKSVEFKVQIRYSVEENIITQTFLFLSKPFFRYAYDTRFSLNSKIEEMIARNILTRIEGVSFVDRTDNVDSVVMKYSFSNEISWSDIKQIFVTLHVYFPPNTGCRYCLKAEEKGEFIYCPEKDKTFPLPIKRCAVFKQKRDIILT